MNQQILSIETIRAMIPLIQGISDDLEQAFQVADRSLRATPELSTDLAVAEDLERLQGFVDELERLGGTLRSYAPVRADFICEVDGEIGYVCWESGDSEAMHFHGAMEGCKGLVLTN